MGFWRTYASRLAWLSLAISSSALGGELKWTHFGLRPLAMGNAYVAVADDFNSIFYNPAGLARLKEWDGEFLNPTLEVSSRTVNAITELNTLLGSGSGNISDTINALQKQLGAIHHFAFGLTPHLIFKGFGFGIGAELATTMAVHQSGSIDLDFGPRIIAPVAFAMNLFEERLAVGAGIKFLARGGVNREFGLEDLSVFTKKSSSTANQSGDQKTLEKFIQGGFGVGFDTGLLFTPFKTMEPTLGLSIMDVGGTSYSKMNVSGEALGAPAARLPAVNAGFSFKPIQTPAMYTLIAIDAHAINQPEHFSKKFNMGVEWGYSQIIKVDAGLHQGYMTGGFQFDVGLLNLRFVTYAEEFGAIAGQEEALMDRRYAVQLKLLI